MSPTTLIITEKPSVAKTIAGFINATKSENSYFTNDEYCICWAAGHLLQYDRLQEKWHNLNLPLIQTPNIIISRGKSQLVNNIKKALKTFPIKTIINCTDAGREGELIYRLIFNHCICLLYTSPSPRDRG